MGEAHPKHGSHEHPPDHAGHRDPRARGPDAERGGDHASTSVLRDPVCGMTVAETSSHRAQHAGRTYYFCSARCQSRFVAEPTKFVADARSDDARTASGAVPSVASPPPVTIYTCPMQSSWEPTV